jgi:hypothetical protein
LLKNTALQVSLKVMVYSGSFHYAIGNMADFNFTVYSYRQVGYRTEPNVMIALAMPHKITPVFMQNFTDFFSYSAIMQTPPHGAPP